ncbi:hypothetical protein EJ05DRAFT_286088 [Pseudovirgaria hyperparasitica]|uniref:DUF7514 domain-containing protein n=1 Tax=Pseudovirgaria hyperparasitica TaxID=470096 RepID=A0A6A6WCB9_9PEZI|nr:uncharacterized protein EJ05DRAFT_286088 [Pseudovirgaria hyperparasitica]KAF2760478.1 hypothetical protein EJ05DRAFT_286088 [Pseudovirgaria hyperparasitica]
MAYDRYRSPNADKRSQYTSQDHSDALRYDSAHDNKQRRSRGSSCASSVISDQAQPIHDAAQAVQTAFDRSQAASEVDPNLIKIITEQVSKQVIDSLKSSGIHRFPQSKESTPDSFPSRNVYTPPSPTRQSDYSNASDSPRQRSAFDGQDETPTPRLDRVHRTMSTTSQTSTDQSKRDRERPVISQKVSPENEATPLENTWERLFEEDGTPTPRVNQFLRGLAQHLIDDYEPKKSIVVTPDKMLRFYRETQVDDEIFPWGKIFCKLPNTSISKMYRDLRCQHHMVQEIDGCEYAPSIPGLTPHGFRRWMETMIRAYPDVEFQRLAKAVKEMPISNPDKPTERFPKALSRRLLPKSDNMQYQQLCCATLACEGKVPLHRPTSFPPPPPLNSQPSTQSQATLERDRSPYSGAPGRDTADSSDHETPVGVPIERERKPYTAREGTGKFYDKGDNDRSNSKGNRLHRSQSNASATSAYSPGRESAADYSQSSSRQSRAYKSTNGRRRSPSYGRGASYGNRSDSSVTDIPANQYASNMYDYEESRYREAESKRSEHTRRPTGDDVDRSYPPGPRSVYDDDYYHRSRSTSNVYGGNYPTPYSQPPPPSSRY